MKCMSLFLMYCVGVCVTVTDKINIQSYHCDLFSSESALLDTRTVSRTEVTQAAFARSTLILDLKRGLNHAYVSFTSMPGTNFQFVILWLTAVLSSLKRTYIPNWPWKNCYMQFIPFLIAPKMRSRQVRTTWWGSPVISKRKHDSLFRAFLGAWIRAVEEVSSWTALPKTSHGLG